MTTNEPQENCMVSLVIPKESIKTSCSGGSNYYTDQKLKSVESQLSSIRKDMNNFNIRLTYTLSRGTNERDTVELSRKLDKLEATVKDLQTNFTREQDNEKEAFADTMNRRKFVRLIRSTLRKELANIKEDIKRDIHYEFRQQLKDDIRSELKSYAVRNNKLVHGINSEILLNTVENDFDQYERSNTYRVNKQHRPDPNNQLTNIYTDHDTFESALNNELPEKPQSKIIQPESQAEKLDIKEAIVILNNEVVKHLEKQTKQVKDIVGHHLNVTESKLSTVSENLSKKFETMSPGREYKEISQKFEQIEHDISTLGTGLSSLLQENNIFSNEIKKQIELEKVGIERSIISKLSGRSNPLKLELENLKNKTQAMSNLIQATANSQKQTQYSLQNFNATYKLKNFYLEQSIRRMTEQIQELNMTINPEYDGILTVDEALHEVTIEDTINFVAEIKDLWPAVLENISSIVKVHKKDLDFVEEGFKHTRSNFDNVLQKQTQCFDRINKLHNELRKIKDTLDYNEQVNRNKALENNEWAQFNFNHTHGRSGCFGGKKFVKKTGYEVGSYVGVVLCSEKRYKIYLSDSLDEMFLNIGDTNKTGEDHCEFVGADRNSSITLQKGATQFERIQGNLNLLSKSLVTFIPSILNIFKQILL